MLELLYIAGTSVAGVFWIRELAFMLVRALTIEGVPTTAKEMRIGHTAFFCAIFLLGCAMFAFLAMFGWEKLLSPR